MPSVDVLSEQELLTLAGLLRVLVLADHAIDGQELDALDRVGRRVALGGPTADPYRSITPPAMGSDAFRALFGRTYRLLPDTAAVRAAAERVERSEARDVMFAILFDVAASNGIAPEEQALLDWLKERWRIETHPVEDARAGGESA